jgi:hypothetical protein
LSTEVLGVLVGVVGLAGGPIGYALGLRRTRLSQLQEQIRDLRRMLVRLANEEILEVGSDDLQRLKEQAETLNDLSQQLPRNYRKEIQHQVLNRLDRIVNSAVLRDPHRDERAWLDAVSLQQRESLELLPVVERCLGQLRRSLRSA